MPDSTVVETSHVKPIDRIIFSPIKLHDIVEMGIGQTELALDSHLESKNLLKSSGQPLPEDQSRGLDLLANYWASQVIFEPSALAGFVDQSKIAIYRAIAENRLYSDVPEGDKIRQEYGDGLMPTLDFSADVLSRLKDPSQTSANLKKLVELANEDQASLKGIGNEPSVSLDISLEKLLIIIDAVSNPKKTAELENIKLSGPEMRKAITNKANQPLISESEEPPFDEQQPTRKASEVFAEHEDDVQAFLASVRDQERIDNSFFLASIKGLDTGKTPILRVEDLLSQIRHKFLKRMTQYYTEPDNFNKYINRDTSGLSTKFGFNTVTVRKSLDDLTRQLAVPSEKDPENSTYASEMVVLYACLRRGGMGHNQAVDLCSSCAEDNSKTNPQSKLVNPSSEFINSFWIDYHHSLNSFRRATKDKDIADYFTNTLVSVYNALIDTESQTPLPQSVETVEVAKKA